MTPNPLMRQPGAGGLPNTPNSDQYVARNFFVYETNIGSGNSLTPSGSTTSIFNIDGDSDFFWTKFSVHVNSGNDATDVSSELLPEINLIITNTTTGRQYMNAPVPAACISGNGRLPFILPMVTYWPAKSSIQVSYQNVSDNATYTAVELSFIGIKAFPR